MDLAEIRKKARQQNTADADEGLARQFGNAAALPTDGHAEKSLPARVEHGASAAGLSRFFPGCDFSTEEEYIQGLSDRDQGFDIETVRWLTFKLGREEYALSLDVVLELIKPRFLTDLPKVPVYVKGIISLRGEVVPVLDLRLRLKLGEREESSQQRIIICEGAEQLIGLLVDRIIQVVPMPKDAIEPAPLVLNELEKDYVSAIGRYQGRMLILLNPDKILRI